MDRTAITRRILEHCHELGFALAGVCDAAPSSYRREYEAWLSAGRNGDMEYLRRNVELRVDPRAMVAGARSIICVADRYASSAPDGEAPSHEQVGAPSQPALGRIARYAHGQDYHQVMRARLHNLRDALRADHPLEHFRVCVDTAPVLEREHAQRAGLGAVGKHTLLLERGLGSYLLLGEIITTLALAGSTPSPSPNDPCGSCTRCIDACPTAAITPWSVDATRCISYLTIEHRSEIALHWHAAIGQWMFGCDICQDVCPHNQPTEGSRSAPVHEAYAPQRTAMPLLDVLGWDEAARRAAFAGSAMNRATLPMIKRNALVVAGNAIASRRCDDGARDNDDALRRTITRISGDDGEHDLVRTTAQQVLTRLTQR